MINAYMGGTLYQDLIKSGYDSIMHTDGSYLKKAKHAVKSVQNTPMFELCSETLVVNCYHHQGVDKLSEQLKAMAIAEEGLIESFYCPEKKFVWGVQWHPERPYDEGFVNEIIFNCFIDTA